MAPNVLTGSRNPLLLRTIKLRNTFNGNVIPPPYLKFRRFAWGSRLAEFTTIPVIRRSTKRQRWQILVDAQCIATLTPKLEQKATRLKT